MGSSDTSATSAMYKARTYYIVQGTSYRARIVQSSRSRHRGRLVGQSTRQSRRRNFHRRALRQRLGPRGQTQNHSMPSAAPPTHLPLFTIPLCTCTSTSSTFQVVIKQIPLLSLQVLSRILNGVQPQQISPVFTQCNNSHRNMDNTRHYLIHIFGLWGPDNRRRTQLLSSQPTKKDKGFK